MGKAEVILVGIKLAILALLMLAGAYGCLLYTSVSGDNVCVLPSQEDEQIARHTWAIQKKRFR